MKRQMPFVVAGLVLALDSGSLSGQDNRGVRELDVSITLESASQSRAAAANLELPFEQQLRSPAASREQQRRFEPADFSRPNRLESVQIAADDLPRGTTAVAVRCQAFIGRDSSLGEYFCISDDNRVYADVVTAVIDAVPAQRFVAARVDGQNVRVLMNFAVYIDCNSGSCIAVAGRNHGYHIEQLGLDYVDPQPILERDDWYDGFAYKWRWVGDWMPRVMDVDRWPLHHRLPYVMAADVDANGEAARGCLYWWGISNSQASRTAMTTPLLDPRTIRDLESAISSLGNVRYLPGMVDGRPAPLRFYEQSVAQLSVAPSDVTGFGVGHIACNWGR
jgi:hypothetical protein